MCYVDSFKQTSLRTESSEKRRTNGKTLVMRISREISKMNGSSREAQMKINETFFFFSVFRCRTLASPHRLVSFVFSMSIVFHHFENSLIRRLGN